MRRVVVCLALLACGSSGSPAGSKSQVETGSGSGKSDAQNTRELRDVVLGVNAHVVVMKSTGAFSEYRDVLHTVERHPDVVAAEPFQFAELLAIVQGGTPVGVFVKGVDPTRVGSVLALGKTIMRGSLAALAEAGDPAPLILGVGLATKLGVTIGDTVYLVQPLALPSDAGAPRRGAFRVAGMFHTSSEDYDDRLAYTSLTAIQALLGDGDTAIGVEATVKYLDTSQLVAHAIERELGGAPYTVMDWFEVNKHLFVTRN